MPRHRGSSHARYNLHGRVLVDHCLGASLFLGTGRLPGDALAPASFSRGGSGCRIDHFLMDGCTLARVAHSGVDVGHFDSDHKPVTLTLNGPQIAAPAAGLSPPPGTRIPRLHWDGSGKDKYVANMKDQAASDAIVQCHALVDSGHIEEAFHKLGDIMVDSAAQAGCKKSRASTRRKGPCKDKPYFDEECRRLRAQFRHAVRHDREAVRVLALRLSFTIRRKCRQYRQRQTPVLLLHLRSNHKCFWQRLNSPHAGLPAALSHHDTWASYHRTLCAPPPAPLQPSGDPPASAPPPVESLEGDITQQEVEQALPKLSNGKSAAQAGWPAELLWYVAYYIDTEDGHRLTVWILAPLLARLLNACFISGRLPACISSALVTPRRDVPLILPTTADYCGRAIVSALHHHIEQ